MKSENLFRWETFKLTSTTSHSKEQRASRRVRILELKKRGLTARQIGAALSPPVGMYAVRNLIARMRKEGQL